MVSTREALSSLDDFNGTNILLRYNSEIERKGKGRIYIDHGSFNNVLYVPGLVAYNILSVYQMNHNGSPKKVLFTPSDVENSKITNGRVISKGFVDHSSKVYKFSHFMPFSNPFAFLTHANEANKIFHDTFGHLN